MEHNTKPKTNAMRWLVKSLLPQVGKHHVKAICQWYLQHLSKLSQQVLLQKLTISNNHLEVREEDIDEGHEHSGQCGGSCPFDSIEVIKKAIDILSKGALAELVSLKPMISTAKLWHNTAHAVLPIKSHANTLKITPNEMLLLTALQEAEA